MDRPLYLNERRYLTLGLRELLNWDNERIEKETKYLRVVSMCDCGEPTCLDIMFQHHVRGETRGLGHMFLEDGRILIIHVHPEKNKISELEII